MAYTGDSRRYTPWIVGAVLLVAGVVVVVLA